MSGTANPSHRDPSGPKPATIKRLFAHSGNRCAFPRCTADIVQGTAIVGEICHIKARAAGGPRYDAQQSPEDRHGYENIILLCANHHSVIDDDPEAYTVDRLVKMKTEHAQRAASMPDAFVDQGALLLVDQSITAMNQSGGITAHTININLGGASQALESAGAPSSLERNHKPYAEDLKRIVRQLIHSQMTLEGRLALRHLLIHEPIEVGRTFLTEIPQERLHAQLGIAMASGVVQHKEVKNGMRRTYWIINPRFRPVLEEMLYEGEGSQI